MYIHTNKCVMEKIYNITEFSKLVGKSVKTLQRWDREGILTSYRSPSNRRYYTQSQYNEYMGITKSEDKINVIYTRVSNRCQQDDLKNQLSFIIGYTKQNSIPISNIYSDIGSGLNYNRKAFNKLIEDAFSGKIGKVYISYKDRFVRFGYDWICSLLKKYCNVDIININDIITSPEEDLINDLVSIIHVFSCRIYGLRKYKSKIKKVLDND